MAQIMDKISTVEQQRELFLWKFKEIDRADINDLLKDFKKHDVENKGQLDEAQAMKMFERRGSVKTATELRQYIGDLDKDNNHKISFLEWCCAHYQKSYDDLNDFVDEAAREKALEEAKKASEEAAAVEREMERIRLQKEKEAEERAAQLERESSLKGVAGMKAFFARQMEGASDSTKTNEQQIKEEAARRRALKDAKLRMNSAITNINRTKSADEVAKEVALSAEQQAAKEAEEKAKQLEEEKRKRAERKAQLNKQWSGTGLEKVVKAKRLSIKLDKAMTPPRPDKY